MSQKSKPDTDIRPRAGFVCSICQRTCEGWGNNPHPINDGRCCNDCDWQVVLPARLRRLGYKNADALAEVVRIKSLDVQMALDKLKSK